MPISISDLLTNETNRAIFNYPEFSYVGGYFAIYFSLLLAFIITTTLILCCIVSCCVSCFKNNDDDDSHEKQKFLILNYKNLHYKDRDNLSILYVKKQKRNCGCLCCGSDQTYESDQTDESDQEKDIPDNNQESDLIKKVQNKDKSELENNEESNFDNEKEIDGTTRDTSQKCNPQETTDKINKTNRSDSSDDSNDPNNPNGSNKPDVLIDVDKSKKSNKINKADESTRLITSEIKIINATDAPNINDNQMKSSKNKSKIYLYYLFDNMNKTNSITDFSPMKSNRDQFVDLEIFVNMVLNTANPKNTVILLGISSPGGYAYKFELAYTRLVRLRNAGFKLVALIDDICASGGYMLASACNEIVCSEYASIGSIGVVTSIYNYYDLIKKIGVIEKTITTGQYKRPYPTGEPLEQQHIDMVKEGVQDTLNIFSNIVKKSRNFTDDEMKDILNAKVWYGRKAFEKKLIDKISTSGEYIDTLFKQHSENNVYVVIRKSENGRSFIRSILESTTRHAIKSLIENATDIFKKIMTNRSIHEQLIKYDIDKIV